MPFKSSNQIRPSPPKAPGSRIFQRWRFASPPVPGVCPPPSVAGMRFRPVSEPLGSRERASSWAREKLGRCRITRRLYTRCFEPQCHRKAASFVSITNASWINTHLPLDLVPGCAVHLTASRSLGVSPTPILLPDPILRGCSGACLADQVSSFSFSPVASLLPLFRVYAQVPA